MNPITETYHTVRVVSTCPKSRSPGVAVSMASRSRLRLAVFATASPAMQRAPYTAKMAGQDAAAVMAGAEICPSANPAGALAA